MLLVCWCGICGRCTCSWLLSREPQSDELSLCCPTESVTVQGLLSQHYIQVIFRPVMPSCWFSSLENWINLWHNLSLLSWESCAQLLNLMLLKRSKVKRGYEDRKKKKKTNSSWQEILAKSSQTESFPSLKEMLRVTYRNVPAFAHKV